MNLKGNAAIHAIMERLKEGMLFFIEEEEYYEPARVDECMGILNAYLETASAIPDRAALMKEVEKAVIALNELNEKCDHALIETDQREDICEIIIMAGNLRGFNTMQEDLTENWRDW